MAIAIDQAPPNPPPPCPKGEGADKSNLSALSPPFPRKQWMFAAAYLGAMVHHPPLLERSSLAQVAADVRTKYRKASVSAVQGEIVPND